MPRLLVLTRHAPLPWEDGSGAYLFDILAYLHHRGFEVHVGWLAPHDHLRWRGIWTLPPDYASIIRLHTPDGWRCGRRIVFPAVYWLPRKARMLDRTKRVLARLGLRVGRRPSADPTHRPPATGHSQPATGWMSPPSPAEHAFATRLLAEIRPTAVLANYAWMTPLFDDTPADLSLRRVCLHHDVAWRRAAHQSALTGRPPEITAAAEADFLRKADTIACIAEADIADHRALLPDSDFVLAPKSVRPAPVPPATGSRLLFVGSDNRFNSSGLAWFLSAVWPAIRAGCPGAELDVCGTVARSFTERPPGVRFHGSVPDLEAFYREAALVIVPLLHATGLNIKLVDAAARGRAIVTTPAALAGAPFLAGMVAAAAPEDFGRTVLELLATPAARLELAERCLATVRVHLTPDACYGTLAAALS